MISSKQCNTLVVLFIDCSRTCENFVELVIEDLKSQGFNSFFLCLNTLAFSNLITSYKHSHVIVEKEISLNTFFQQNYFEIKHDNYLFVETKPYILTDYSLLLAHDFARGLKYTSISQGPFYSLDNKFKIIDRSQDGLTITGTVFLHRTKINKLSASDVNFKNCIGIPLGGKSISTLRSDVFKENKRPCLFLDRDGIINVDTGYVSSPEQIKIYPAIIDLIKLVQKKGWYTIILTNQSGIGKGLYSEEDLENTMEKIFDIFDESSVKIDDWYYCPYHPDATLEKFKKDSFLRKPLPGMAMLAQEKYPIDIKSSYMIGDKVSDSLLLPKLKTCLIKGDYPLENAPPNTKIFSNHDELISFFKTTLDC